MQAMRDGTGTTSALVVLHDLNLAARFADRIALIAGGRCLLAGPPPAVLGSELLDAAFETRFRRIEIDGRLVLIPEGGGSGNRPPTSPAR
jgi:iron complex transport system ATP-binding protein